MWSFLRGKRSARLLFAGDVMVHEKQLRAALGPGGAYDFSGSFAFIAPVIRGADFAAANLEVPLPGGPPYTGYPVFRCPDAIVPALKRAGFTFLLTANNHALDAGDRAALRTAETITAHGLGHAGVYESEEARRRQALQPVRCRGLNVAVLNYTYGAKPPPAGGAVVSFIDEDLMHDDLRRAREAGVDAVAVCLHWGREYGEQEHEDQRALAGRLFSWGADVVVGSHSHVPQRVERRVVDGRMCVAAYSLGNFISSQLQPYTDGGLLLEIGLEGGRSGGRAGVVSVRSIPVWRFIRYDDAGHPAGFAVVPVEEALAGRVKGLEMYRSSWEAMKAFAARCRELEAAG